MFRVRLTTRSAQLQIKLSLFDVDAWSRNPFHNVVIDVGRD